MKNLFKVLIISFLMFSCGEDTREEVLERYENGSKKIVGIYSGKGSEEILKKKIYFFPNGQIEKEENFNEEQQRHGMYLEYFEDGKIKIETEYRDGKIFNGRIPYSSRIVEYPDGRKERKFFQCFEDSEVKYLDELSGGDKSKVNRCYGEYKNGKREGVWTLSNPSNWDYVNKESFRFRGEGNYQNNKKDGEWVWEIQYRYGDMITIKQNYNKGELIEETLTETSLYRDQD